MTALLALYPKLDPTRVRARVRELAMLADAPEVPGNLEAAIAAAENVRSATRPSRAKEARKASRSKDEERPRSRSATKKQDAARTRR